MGADTPSPASTVDESSSTTVLEEYGRRLGRDTVIYTIGSGLVLVVSLITLIVFTHYMTPAQYGSLAILFSFAGALTIVLNLIPLAGVMRWVYVAGEADVGAIDDPSRQAPGGTKSRALGTGWWMSLVAILLGCGILLPLSAPLGQLLLGNNHSADSVRLAIASGATGSVFRLTSNVLRMERRPVAFSLILGTRPLIALAVAVPLVANGEGINGGLIGTTAGSTVAGLIAIFLVRHSYSANFNWHDAREIVDLGSRYTFVILGLFTVHNGDAWVMSRFASHAEVGVYRVAARLSSIISYLVSAFLLAWAPLERSPLFQATYDLHGEVRMHSRMLTYFILSGLAITLGLSLAGDVLVRLSPPAYSSAANLIPITSFSFVVYGTYVVIARTTAYKHRDFVHNFSSGMAAVIYVVAASFLVPPFGGYGLALSSIIGMTFATACFRAIDRSATRYAALEWRKLIPAAAITFACLALGRAADTHNGFSQTGLNLIDFFVVYPAVMILTRVVTPTDARVLWQMAVGIVEQLLSPVRPGRGGVAIATALSQLNPRDVELLHELIKDRVPPTEVARRDRVALSVVEARSAHALRQLTGSGGSERDDSALGYWLFNVRGSAERDVVRTFLIERGLPLLTLHAVEAAAARLKTLPGRLWPQAQTDRIMGDPAMPIEPVVGL
jgi:O-antigen/teichoic acid export membrane protein